MDRAYFDLIRCCIECANLANYIAKNCNYNQEIMARTNVYISSAYHEASHLRQCLNELLQVQAISTKIQEQP